MFFEKLEGDYLIYNFSVDKGLAKLLPETMFRNYVSVEKTHIYIYIYINYSNAYIFPTMRLLKI